MNKTPEIGYQHLIDSISSTFAHGQQKTISAINTGLVMTYWQIGQHLVEFEQNGNKAAEYGKKLLSNLSRDLKLKHGKGFSLSNLKRFRQFYLLNRNGATLSHQLSWSHHVELLKMDNEVERDFYTKQSLAANWSVRELKRQKDSGLFLRLAASKNKEKILALAQQNTLIAKPEDIQRDSYVFEFLNLPERENYSERELVQLSSNTHTT